MLFTDAEVMMSGEKGNTFSGVGGSSTDHGMHA